MNFNNPINNFINELISKISDGEKKVLCNCIENDFCGNIVRENIPSIFVFITKDIWKMLNKAYQYKIERFVFEDLKNLSFSFIDEGTEYERLELKIGYIAESSIQIVKEFSIWQSICDYLQKTIIHSDPFIQNYLIKKYFEVIVNSSNINTDFINFFADSFLLYKEPRWLSSVKGIVEKLPIDNIFKKELYNQIQNDEILPF